MTFVILSKSLNPNKKYTVKVYKNKDSSSFTTIHFGAAGYSDYTIHKDPLRLQRYNKRHSRNENWTKSGISSAGFWSKWLLWSKPTLKAAKQLIRNKFGVVFKGDSKSASSRRKSNYTT